MASNSFGKVFCITTFGESRSEQMGVVIDGCPPNIEISQEEIDKDLQKRKPGRWGVSQRQESDRCKMISGVFEGKTTGAPICILISNEERKEVADCSLLKPGHASFSYLHKYGNFDPRGGGRASARETALRVAAASIAKKMLQPLQINVLAYLSQMGEIVIEEKESSFEERKKQVDSNPFFCPDNNAAEKMKEKIKALLQEGDTIGGVVSYLVENVPPCLGEPLYEKFHARLAHALMSIPGAKGFTIGEGFGAAVMQGSQHNDPIDYKEKKWMLTSNHAGGVLGGITTGMSLWGSVAFKPASSIAKVTLTRDRQGRRKPIASSKERNDVCIALRACPVVEAMIFLVLADMYLLCRRSESFAPLQHGG